MSHDPHSERLPPSGHAAPAEAPQPPAAAPEALSRSAWAYALSLPERALRSGTGLAAGVLRESASLLVPRAFQNSRTYTVTVRQTLDFLIHDVGGVDQQAAASSTAGIDNYVARKAIGNFVDMASLATLHISPLVILAAISDLAYGSKVYLHELADELKAQGVIASDSTIDHVNDLLAAVSDASEATGKAFNTPPLSADALRKTLDETRAAIASAKGANILPQAEVRRMWEEMRDIADREQVGMLAVSGAVTMHALGKFATLGRGALSTVKVAGTLFDKHVLDHYAEAVSDIRRKGLYQSLAETSRPYTAAVWKNFQPHKSTVTEDVLSGKLWRDTRGWLGRRGQPPKADETAEECK